MKQVALFFICLALGFTGSLQAGYTTFEMTLGSGDNPTTIEVIPLEATVVQSPAEIKIKTYVAGTFSIYRKAVSDTTWGTAVATGVSLAAQGTWSDTTVSVGTLYEYRFENTAGTTIRSIYPSGYILTGIAVDQTQPKGRLALVVASDVPTTLPAEYAQYKSDLMADGWTVHEIQVPRAANYNGVGNGAIATVKVNTGGSGFVTGSNVYLVNAGGKKAYGTLTVSGGAITAVSILSNAGGSGFAVNDALTIEGGPVGTGASLKANIDASQSTLIDTYPLTGGSGYTDRATVTLTGQSSGKTAQCKIYTYVPSGEIYYIQVTSSQTGFILNEELILSGNSTGSGVGYLSAASLSSGALTFVNIQATGSGYTQDDAATLTGNLSGKTAQVTLDVDENGVIIGANIISAQTGFTPGETLALSGTSTGSGVGPFVSSVSGPLQSITVVAGGANYVNGNAVTLSYGSATAQGVLNVTAGAITSVTLTSSGAGFVHGGTLSLSGLVTSATGYNLQVLTVDNSGAGRGVTVAAGGSGYRDNDAVTITGSSSGATAKGSLIAPSGAVVGVSAVLPNTFTVGESLTLAASSGGSGATATAGTSLENHLLIRGAVQAVNSAYPGELKNVVLLGKVPVCRSGHNDGFGADGHGNQAPYAADAFYADMDGVVGTQWTDTQNNTSSANVFYNIPGDNQFDQQKISQVGGNGAIELGYGRIDISHGIKMEWEAMRSYFNKLHRYKTASPDFLPGKRICDRLSYQNVRETAIQSMPSVVGWNNIDAISKNAPPTVNGGDDPDAAYSADHGPYLFYFKGGSGPLNGEGGKAVFWTGMQSHYGYWYDSNLMVQRLAEDSFCLSWTWDIWGLRYIYHRMGMGLDAADMMKQSLNNRGWSPTGTYPYRFNNTSNGDYHGALYMNNMGDPALRLFMFAPPSKLSVVKSGSNPSLSWTASPEPTVSGYHVYRKPSGNGPYTRLTSTPQAGTTYTDATVSSGKYTYMVRAVRLETTGGGTYYNPSLGIEQTLDLSNAPAAISITNTSLANAYWNTAYSETLNAQGGVPQFTWSVVSGSLPAGLALSTDGIISGTPTVAGVFTFTVKATDQTAATAQKVFSITCSSNQAIILTPEATAHTSKQTPTNNYGTVETNYITGHSTYMYETFQRYDLTGVNLNNGFVRATLQLYVSSETAANTYSLVQGNLLADSQDIWTEAGRSVPFETTYANNGSGKIRLTCFGHGFLTGNQVTIEGFPASPPNGLHIITKVDDDHFDIPANFAGAGLVDPALAYATAANINYNNRPTTYNASVPTLSASGSPVAGTLLEMDVTSFVAETLANDPAKLMSLRLFTTGQQTVYVGSRRAYGAGKPRLVIETSDAPSIAVSSPTVNPAYLYAGSGLQITALAAAIPARAGSLSVLWTKLSGPGAVTFSSPATASTTATFATPGSYVLRLAANDGVLQSFKDLNVWVLPTGLGTAPAAGPNDGLILRLAFDESSGTTATDFSGVSPSNNGTLSAPTVGSPLPEWKPVGGKLGGAVSLQGNNQRVEIPDSTTTLLDGMEKLSASLWVKTNTTDANSRAILVKRTSATSSTAAYAITLNASRQVVAVISNKAGATSNFKLTAGEWCHVAMIYDGALASNNLQLYINGVPDKFVTVTGLTGNLIPRKAGTPLRVGDYITGPLGGTTLSLDGMVDEVRLYNRVLSLAEIQNLYSAAPSNMGPRITLTTPTVSGPAGTQLALGATVTDDGLPGAVTLGWSKASGPGSVVFSNPVSSTTNATTSTAGSYGLRITANDGSITTFAEVAASFEASGGIDSWRMLHFGTTLNEGNAADGANPMRDGLSNLLKYVLGLDPNVDYSNSPLAPKGQMENVSGQDYLTFTFTRDTAVTDATLSVEVINDLTQTTWTTIDPLNPTNQVEVLENTPSAGIQTITVKDTQPVTANAKRFMRLKVTRP